MRLIDSIGMEARQRLILTPLDDDITVTLRYLSQTRSWCMDLAYLDKLRFGQKVALGAPLLRSRDFPFDFVVVDNSGNGVDPFLIEDFTSGRCSLYYLDPLEADTLRGFTVEEE